MIEFTLAPVAAAPLTLAGPEALRPEKPMIAPAHSWAEFSTQVNVAGSPAATLCQ